MKCSRNVELLAYLPNPEVNIATAAKLCYSKSGIAGIQEHLTEEKATDFLDMLMDIGHASPIEHSQFTFGIEGISRVLTHQLVRHRIGTSYSQQSQRYVELKQFQYIIPPSIEKDEESRKLFEETMDVLQKSYHELTERILLGLLSEKWGHIPSDKRIGVAEAEDKRYVEKQKKIAIEDARYVFPNACETKIIVSMNARALIHFFEHRCCYRAQWEIRDLAWEMLELVSKVAPTLFKNAGPKCLCGVCPEGKMSCGNQKLVQDRKKSLLEEK